MEFAASDYQPSPLGNCNCCGLAVTGLREPHGLNKNKSSQSSAGYVALLCRGCGNIMKKIGGRAVPLTKEEKSRLPIHRFSVEIKLEQSKIIERMIG